MKHGHCRLCGNEGTLCKSHIIPESLYKTLYDERTHRYNLISSSAHEPNKRPSQGFYEYLLCRKCEEQLGEYDNYAKGLIESAINHANVQGDILEAQSVDYTKIKLFQLSVLWRASISTLEYFSVVSLGCHEERIRIMLVAKDPGRASDYPCLMALLEDDVMIHAPVPDASRQPSPSDMMISPLCWRVDGIHVYRFCYAGFGWAYAVGSVSPPKWIQECAAREDGRLLIRKLHLSVLFGPREIKILGDRGKLVKR